MGGFGLGREDVAGGGRVACGGGRVEVEDQLQVKRIGARGEGFVEDPVGSDPVERCADAVQERPEVGSRKLHTPSTDVTPNPVHLALSHKTTRFPTGSAISECRGMFSPSVGG